MNFLQNHVIVHMYLYNIKLLKELRKMDKLIFDFDFYIFKDNLCKAESNRISGAMLEN